MRPGPDRGGGPGSTGSFGMIILAGGRGRRLGGRDKPGLVVGGRTLLRSVVAAAVGAGARQLIVVGPPRPGYGPGVRFVTEEPPGAGPVPALRRGLAEMDRLAGADPHGGAAGPWTALLAADLPFLRAGHLGALLRAAERAGAGAVLADDSGWPAAGGPRRCAPPRPGTPATRCAACSARSPPPWSGWRRRRGSRRHGWTATRPRTCAGRGLVPCSWTTRTGARAYRAERAASRAADRWNLSG